MSGVTAINCLSEICATKRLTGELTRRIIISDYLKT